MAQQKKASKVKIPLDTKLKLFAGVDVALNERIHELAETFIQQDDFNKKFLETINKINEMLDIFGSEIRALKATVKKMKEDQ